MSRLGSRKLWVTVVAFFAPYITQYATGAIGWREAVRLSVIAAAAYCVAQGAADAGQAVATSGQRQAEILADARRPVRRPPREVV